MAVSLSEINSFAADPEITDGKPRVVIDNKNVLDNVMRGAMYKADNDRQKYTLYLNNFNEFLKNNNQDLKEVMVTDVPELAKGLKEAMAEALKNPQAIANPFSNPTAYAGMVSKFQDLNSKIAKSKAQNAYLQANQKYKSLVPELNTDENNKEDLHYMNTPLSQRSEFVYKFPSLFNPKQIAEEANEKAKRTETKSGFEKTQKFNPKTQKFLFDEKGNPILEDDPRYIRTKTRAFYDKPTYDKNWNALMTTADKRGLSKRDEAMKFYEGNSSLKEQYPTYEAYEEAIRDALFNDKSETTKDELTETDYAKLQSQLAVITAKGKEDRKTKGYEHQLKSKDDDEAAIGLLKSFAAITKNAINSNEKRDLYNRNGTLLKGVIVPLTPSNQGLFGVSIKGKEGKDETLYPDKVIFHKDRNTYSVLFYERYTEADADENHKVGDIKQSAGKKNIYNEYTKIDIPFDDMVTTYGNEMDLTNGAKGKAINMYNKNFGRNWTNIPLGDNNTSFLDDNGELKIKK